MKKWRRHMRGTVKTAFTGAALGALGGVLVEALNDVLPGGLPMGSLFDVWPPVLAIAGFLGGALASSALRLVGRSRIQ